MSSTCVCHNKVNSFGYVCSHCLSLYCREPILGQLKQLDQDGSDFAKRYE